jgi:hypothetical protein
MSNNIDSDDGAGSTRVVSMKGNNNQEDKDTLATKKAMIRAASSQ